MTRASYQRIDNIRIGKKPATVALVKANHTTVTVCPTPSIGVLRPVREDGVRRPYRPMLHLKV